MVLVRTVPYVQTTGSVCRSFCRKITRENVEIISTLKSGTPRFAGKLPPRPQTCGPGSPSAHKVKTGWGDLNLQENYYSFICSWDHCIPLGIDRKKQKNCNCQIS